MKKGREDPPMIVWSAMTPMRGVLMEGLLTRFYSKCYVLHKCRPSGHKKQDLLTLLISVNFVMITQSPLSNAVRPWIDGHNFWPWL